MLQNIRMQRNGRQSPRSDNNMNDLCIKIYYTEGRKREISFILADFVFHQRPQKLCNVQRFECKLRTMSSCTMGPLETFGNKVVVRWRFRFR